MSGLIAWLYFQDHNSLSRLMSKVFLGGFLSYLFSLGVAEATTEYKLFVLFRDLMVMGILSQIFSLFRNNSLLFFGLLVGLYGLIATKGASILENTFSQQQIAASVGSIEGIELDKKGELLVEINEANKITDIATLLDKYNLSFERAFYPESASSTELDDYYVLNIPDQYNGHLLEIMTALKESAAVDWIEENEIIKLSPMESTPVPVAKKQFGINDPGVEQLWGFDAMNIDQLYSGLAKSKVKPKEKALIAILDTGVDAKHEDIANNFTSIDAKYDTDARGHGTHCAGIAAAVSNNGVGVASFSTNNDFVEVTSIRVLTGFGAGTQKGIINGMILAADNGAAVISMSLGGLANSLKQRAYEKAVEYCNDKGAIVVVAAGNSNKDARNYSPANVEGVITVSAIDQTINRATFSNYITHLKMGIAAPGVGIYSTIPDNKYASFNGTSMATPYVAGLVGVLKSIQPNLTTQEVHAILHKSGKDTNATKETGRLIQPAKALELVID